MKHILFLLFSLSIYAQDTIPAAKSVIALDKMNVVYRGIYNPISIAVNDAKSYKVYGKGVSKDENGNYFLFPVAGLTTKVYVEITKNNDSVVVEEHEFRIKVGKAPIGTINGFYTNRGELTFTLEEIKEAKIGVNILEFYGKDIEVTQFLIKIPNYPSIIVKGNKFSDEVIEILKKCRKNDIVLISDIKANYVGKINGLIKMPRPITFKIIKE